MSRHASVIDVTTSYRQERIDRLTGLFSDNHGPNCIRRLTAVNLAGAEPAKTWIWDCDLHWRAHGLPWWFPRLLDWIRVRGSYEGRRGGGATAVPIDIETSDFVYGQYWVGEEPPTETTIDDPDYYRFGFAPTVLGLEQSVRSTLGLGRQPRSRAQGYGRIRSDTILDSLRWLVTAVDRVVDEDHALLEGLLQFEAQRLLTRSLILVEGSRIEAVRDYCVHCHQVDSVVADDERAFCDNPVCRDRDGRRHCWRRVNGEWVAVPEPDRHVSDEQLEQLRDAS